MSRILLATNCLTAKRDHFWDTDARQVVTVDKPSGAACTTFALPKGTLVDSWYEGSTKVEIKTVWDGIGRMPRPLVERIETTNAPGGGEGSVCGLRIDDVQVADTGAGYAVTIFTSGYDGAIEYSLNQFATVQDSNIFQLTEAGSYIAYARAKR